MNAPTPLPPATQAEVAAALDGLKDVLTRSAELVRDGQLVDLVGLDREVQRTLEAVVALPPPEARALLPALDALLAVLDTIAADLETRHGAVLTGAETKAARRRATAAYRRREEEL